MIAFFTPKAIIPRMKCFEINSLNQQIVTMFGEQPLALLGLLMEGFQKHYFYPHFVNQGRHCNFKAWWICGTHISLKYA